MTGGLWEPVVIRCPYCFERVEVAIDPEDRGELVQDCEVCCNPWQLNIFRDPDGTPHATVERLE